jgi:signal peptidase II
LSGFSVAVSAALCVWLARAESRLVAIALGLTIGGALGNVVDRLRFGAVFDFLDFHAFGWHWPAFSLADSAITLGVAGLLLTSLLGGPRDSKVGRS